MPSSNVQFVPKEGLPLEYSVLCTLYSGGYGTPEDEEVKPTSTEHTG